MNKRAKQIRGLHIIAKSTPRLLCGRDKREGYTLSAASSLLQVPIAALQLGDRSVADVTCSECLAEFSTLQTQHMARCSALRDACISRLAEITSTHTRKP